MRYPFLPLLFLAAFLLVCADQISAQLHPPAKPVDRGIIATVTGTASSATVFPPDVQRRYDTFLKVWTTIRDNYFDKTFSNLDWNVIKGEYEPRVKSAKTDAELYRILNEMLGRLNRSHLSVIPPEVYQALRDARKAAREKERATAPGKQSADAGLGDTADDQDFLDSIDDTSPFGIGVDLSLMNDRFVITRMDPNSAAEYAGLKRGYIIEKVNGVSLQEMLNRILVYNSSIHSTSVKQFVPSYVVSSMLNGGRDTYVTVSYLDENDQPKEAKIQREPLKEKTIIVAANFPPQTLSFESTVLDETTGYIRFNVFAIPVIEKFCQAIGDLKSKSGLILDLRGNTGGVLAAIPTLAGMLTPVSMDLGTSIYRTRSEPLTAPSKAKNFKGRVVVLVDDRTASAAEMFALALRDNGRALIVGQHTSGEALPSLAVKLPTGAMLFYPFANYRSAGGTFIEGAGIEPDRSVPLDRKALFTGKDVQLEAARSLLSDDSAFAGLKPKKQDVPPPPDYSGPVAPPPPAKKAPPSVVGGARLTIPGLAAPAKAPAVQDVASLKLIDAFVKNMGGADALRSIATIAVKGRATLKTGGSSTQFVFQANRENDDKFSELLTSEATGEIREVVNGKTHFVQTDFGAEHDLPATPDMAANSDLFSVLTTLVSARDLYPSLLFKGIFERDGKKTAVIEGRTKANTDLALVFDVENGNLVNFTKGYSSISFGDYRKIGGLSLPFEIDQSGYIKIQLDEIKVNTPIDQSLFTRKVSCFDKVD